MDMQNPFQTYPPPRVDSANINGLNMTVDLGVGLQHQSLQNRYAPPQLNEQRLTPQQYLNVSAPSLAQFYPAGQPQMITYVRAGIPTLQSHNSGGPLPIMPPPRHDFAPPSNNRLSGPPPMNSPAVGQPPQQFHVTLPQYRVEAPSSQTMHRQLPPNQFVTQPSSVSYTLARPNPVDIIYSHPPPVHNPFVPQPVPPPTAVILNSRPFVSHSITPFSSHVVPPSICLPVPAPVALPAVSQQHPSMSGNNLRTLNSDSVPTSQRNVVSTESRNSYVPTTRTGEFATFDSMMKDLVSTNNKKYSPADPFNNSSTSVGSFFNNSSTLTSSSFNNSSSTLSSINGLRAPINCSDPVSSSFSFTTVLPDPMTMNFSIPPPSFAPQPVPPPVRQTVPLPVGQTLPSSVRQPIPSPVGLHDRGFGSSRQHEPTSKNNAGRSRGDDNKVEYDAEMTNILSAIDHLISPVADRNYPSTMSSTRSCHAPVSVTGTLPGTMTSMNSDRTIGHSSELPPFIPSRNRYRSTDRHRSRDRHRSIDRHLSIERHRSIERQRLSIERYKSIDKRRSIERQRLSLEKRGSIDRRRSIERCRQKSHRSSDRFPKDKSTGVESPPLRNENYYDPRPATQDARTKLASSRINESVENVQNSHPLDDFPEILERNKTVASAAILRSVEDASEGEFGNAIETLVTAISLIRRSKIDSTPECCKLVTALQDQLRVIEERAYGTSSSKSDRSPSRVGGSSRWSPSEGSHSGGRQRRFQNNRHDKSPVTGSYNPDRRGSNPYERICSPDHVISRDNRGGEISYSRRGGRSSRHWDEKRGSIDNYYSTRTPADSHLGVRRYADNGHSHAPSSLPSVREFVDSRLAAAAASVGRVDARYPPILSSARYRERSRSGSLSLRRSRLPSSTLVSVRDFVDSRYPAVGYVARGEDRLSPASYRERSRSRGYRKRSRSRELSTRYGSRSRSKSKLVYDGDSRRNGSSSNVSRRNRDRSPSVKGLLTRKNRR